MIDQPPSFEPAFLRGQLKQAAGLVSLGDQNASRFHGLLYLEATRSGDRTLAQSQWEALLADLRQGDREEKLIGEILAGRKPLAVPSLQRLPIEPSNKRVLLAVLAQRYPGQAKELLTLAKKLNYHHDAVSLCLHKFL